MKYHPMKSSPNRLLGFEISHLSGVQQIVLTFGGSIGFNLIYGCLQEYMVVHIFERKFGIFMSLLQTCSFALCAYLQRLHLKESNTRKIPIRWYFLLSFAQSSAMALGNVGMMHLNYAAKVLFKSTKALPMMLWGTVFLKLRYQRRDYLSVAAMVVGLVMFLEADAKSPVVFSLLGVILMIGCVLVDCFYSNLAEYLLKRFDATPEEAIFYTYMGGSMYQLFNSTVSGELVDSIEFISKKAGFQGIFIITLYSVAGYLGANCTTTITKNYGSLNAALASATRKVINLLFSFAFFPKPFTAMHFFGASIFIIGLTAKSLKQNQKPFSKPNTPREVDGDILIPMMVARDDDDNEPTLSNSSYDSHEENGLNDFYIRPKSSNYKLIQRSQDYTKTQWNSQHYKDMV